MSETATLPNFVPLVFKRRGIRRLADTGAVGRFSVKRQTENREEKRREMAWKWA